MRLRIDLAELEQAFEEATGEIRWFLDRETGAVIPVTSETQGELERLYTDLDREGPLSTDELDAVLGERDAGDWERETLQQANQVESDDGTRFLPLPHRDSHAGYRDMEEFIETLPPGSLQDQLWRAIRGRGAFRRFKDVLLESPSEQQRWFAFRDARLRARVLAWLTEEEIEPEDNGVRWAFSHATHATKLSWRQKPHTP
jgi:hypothetical protein